MFHGDSGSTGTCSTHNIKYTPTFNPCLIAKGELICQRLVGSVKRLRCLTLGSTLRKPLQELQKDSQLAVDAQADEVFENDDIIDAELYAEDEENQPPGQLPSVPSRLPSLRLSSDTPEAAREDAKEPEEEEEEPLVTARWRAFLGKDSLAHHQDFDSKAIVDDWTSTGLWRWVDDVVRDLGSEQPPQRASVKSLTATVYTSKQSKELRLVKSLRRGEVLGFNHVREQARQLKETSNEVTRVDFDLKLQLIETPQNAQTRNGEVLQGRPGIRLTATNQ
ncbi:hypothetical protein P171DRAFT_473595 [Karstenula rhodostoma CBS 690.94]|uniref:Uncharacterized protein n=1 Tax=Karstenula rhodostoma CBS 690.94 TaxID=1392251 RepID=A0A9P4UCN9_9PLEO|nr:hypothetical protein P171DRAFT_473595 [Karstenula rhodostoma CBS 690.94]